MTDCRTIQGTYLALVPLLCVLQVLPGQVIVLVADLVDNLSQVGVLRVNLHLHLRVLDLLTQDIHLL